MLNQVMLVGRVKTPVELKDGKYSFKLFLSEDCGTINVKVTEGIASTMKDTGVGKNAIVGVKGKIVNQGRSIFVEGDKITFLTGKNNNE